MMRRIFTSPDRSVASSAGPVENRRHADAAFIGATLGSTEVTIEAVLAIITLSAALRAVVAAEDDERVVPDAAGVECFKDAPLQRIDTACPVRVTAGQQSGPAWIADRAGSVMLGQPNTDGDQFIQNRRFRESSVECRKISVTKIVHKNEDHVWRFQRGEIHKVDSKYISCSERIISLTLIFKCARHLMCKPNGSIRGSLSGNTFAQDHYPLKLPMPNIIRFLTPALSALAVLLAAPKLLAQPTPSRPNILVVVADDWGWGHAGALGDPLVKTPTFDQLAKDGVIFQRAYCASPSCTASSASLLTGQMFYRLEEASVLHGPLRKEFPVYPEILESAGYAIGLAGKGLGPGDFKAGGRDRNPAGPAVESFEKFLDSKSADQLFCFWFGSNNPHRPYNQKPLKGTIDPAKVPVPAYLPDAPEVREDLADYYAEVQAFDSEVGHLVEILKKRNLLNNTLVVVTSDNGIPFPRGKLNLYDSGVRMPTVVSWPAAVPGGRVVEDFVSQTDFAPTFLEAAGLPIPKEMTGRSLLEVLKLKKSGLVDASRTLW